MTSPICEVESPCHGDVVIAIDFGTSRTAYSWTIIGNKDAKVEVEKPEGGSYTRLEAKIPTSVLIKLDTENNRANVIAFGFRAEERYAEDHDPDLYLFRWFKLDLHKPFSNDPAVVSADGKQLFLSVVLEACMEYIKNDAITKLMEKGILDDSDPYTLAWVLTVPAIWSDWAKQMMRRAAYLAGLIKTEQSSRLVLALEPEAACVAYMCDPNRTRRLRRGDSVMIADCGAGTVDITTHEVLSVQPLRMREVLAPLGGALGSTRIDRNFLEFLREFLGTERYEDLKERHTGAFLHLTKEWEEKKQMFQFDRGEEEWVTIPMGDALIELGIPKEEINWMVFDWNTKNKDCMVQMTKSALRLSHELMNSFFQGPVQDVVEKVAEVVRSHEEVLGALNHIILVGGFANCPLLKREMCDRFPITLVGTQPDMLVVKGAALVGCKPMGFFHSRKAKYTFGISCGALYDEHDPVHRMHKAYAYREWFGRQRLSVFSVHGKMGDTLEVGSRTPRKTYMPVSERHTKIGIRILATQAGEVFLADDENVSVLGCTSIPVDMSQPFPHGREIGVEFSLGDTEMVCFVYNSEGARMGRVCINFFNIF